MLYEVITGRRQGRRGCVRRGHPDGSAGAAALLRALADLVEALVAGLTLFASRLERGDVP